MTRHKLHEATLVSIDRKGDGWHGLPGCAGCVNPVDMQHQEGCRLRAKDAGHRHAEDILGRALYVGDEVVAMVRGFLPGRSVKVARPMLVESKVVAITPQRVRVQAKGRTWDVQDHELVKARR
jgi:hypothetical protein